MIGKPYSGKPNVRFDEGELEIEHAATTPALYSTGRMNKKGRAIANPAFHLSTKKMILSDLVHIPIVFKITWSGLLSFPLLDLL